MRKASSAQHTRISLADGAAHRSPARPHFNASHEPSKVSGVADKQDPTIVKIAIGR
jgi:hypothetical protein